MKDSFFESVKRLAAERRLIIALVVFFVSVLVFIIYISFNMHPTELKVVTHYSAFGSTNFYRDAWYYLISFAVFGVALAIIHSLISLRLLVIKGPELALAFVWLSVVIVFIALTTAYQILKVAALA